MMVEVISEFQRQYHRHYLSDVDIIVFLNKLNIFNITKPLIEAIKRFQTRANNRELLKKEQIIEWLTFYNLNF